MRSCYLSVFSTGLKCLNKEVPRTGLLLQRTSNLMRQNSAQPLLFVESSHYHTSSKLFKDKADDKINNNEEKVVSKTETEAKLHANEDEAKKPIKLSKAGKQKKQKKARKTTTGVHQQPEDLVKKVSAELRPGNEEDQRQVEHQLLMQLLKIEKKSNFEAQLKEEESASLFTKLTQKPTKKAVVRKARSGLNIFKITENSIDAATARERSKNKSVWSCSDWLNSMEEDLESKVFNRPYPANAFEEQIMWTEQGKLFKFPIDNEQGVESEELSTPFYQHVFLQSKLEDWCPRGGAISDFMRALCTALSMNPHLSVAEKHQHIEWFQHYFNEKSNLLTALGLLDDDKKSIYNSSS